ncbi:MAG: PQQ-binding-like beta-propeller repeat protein [Planctomycetaceae bacterium]
MIRSILCGVALLSAPILAAAADWPGWRGPTGQGLCSESELPVEWNVDGKNVRWKVALPDEGNSSPIVWGDRVFITQALERSAWPPEKPENFPAGTSVGGPAVAERRSVMCFDRADGKLLWQRDTIYKEPESTHRTNPFCSATPVTDGERVIASHGSAGIVCYDMEGKELWKHDVGRIEQVWGNASSPILHGDLVIQWCSPGARTFLLALDKRTGEEKWRHEEPGGDTGKEGKFLGSWSTPTIARVGEKDQLVLPIPGKLKGFDPLTGKELWWTAGAGNLIYMSPLVKDDVAVLGSTAYRIGGEGELQRARLWRGTGGARVGSGVIADGHVYLLADGGVPKCFDLKTGEDLWKDQLDKRPGTTAWGSMVHAKDKLYITDQRGTTIVLAAGPKYELLAQNELKEHVNASPAISNGDIFIRTWKHLWCIGKTDAEPQADPR